MTNGSSEVEVMTKGSKHYLWKVEQILPTIALIFFGDDIDSDNIASDNIDSQSVYNKMITI
jgi:hypothetical protein